MISGVFNLPHFLFGTGSKEDVITEKANEGTQDQVYFVGVTEFQVGAFKYNNDLLLTINNNTDIVALVDWYINGAVEYAYFDSTNKAYYMQAFANIAVDLTPQATMFALQPEITEINYTQLLEGVELTGATPQLNVFEVC